ncbi:MAG: FtsW/RodA/SpoVE family cell cycle protein, partial [Dehalococcoidia bacterium]
MSAAGTEAHLPRLSAVHVFAFLVLPPLLLLGAPLTVLLATDRAIPADVEAPAILVALLPVLTPLLLRIAGREWDPLLLSPAWVLCALGLAVIARVQPDLLTTQMLWMTLGWTTFIALAGFPPLLDWLRTYRYTWLTAGILLALATLFVGDDVTGQGTRLWLTVGPVTIQPAEVLRVVLIAFLAAYLGERRHLLMAGWRRAGDVSLPPPAYWLPLAGMVGLTLMVVVAQRDFGPSVIYVGSFLGMLYLATGRRAYVGIAVAVFALGALAAFAASGRVQARVDAWLDPWADPQGAGYQSLQAIGGFVFGGVAGAGPGYGFPGLIPAAHTDYPLAVVGEEWGLIGSLAVVMLYGLLVARGIVRAQFARTPFEQLLAAGLALSLAVQVLVVSAGVLRLFPLTGITSPFLSYGGSSMVMAWVMLALLTRSGSRPTPAFTVPLDGVAARMQPVGLALLAGFLVIAS